MAKESSVMTKPETIITNYYYILASISVVFWFYGLIVLA